MYARDWKHSQPPSFPSIATCIQSRVKCRCNLQVLMYTRDWKHIKPLWFSNISTFIMFWTYIKAFFRTQLAKMLGRSITFKTTLKVRASLDMALRRCQGSAGSGKGPSCRVKRQAQQR